MKKLLPILFVLIITSCSKEVPADQLVERNGIKYEVNSQTPFTGASLTYYNNGQLEDRKTYKDGMFDGLQEWYFSNGQLEYRKTYKGGVQVGVYESYFFNGQARARINIKDGMYDGLSEIYSENGKVETIECYKNDEITDMSYCDK
jgi:antitoxin component YwqK of YwqJK toxin-antitoxin module